MPSQNQRDNNFGFGVQVKATRNTKAAILRHLNAPLSVEELDIGELKFGQVLVRIIYSGICRSQLMEQQGFRGEDLWLPHLLGHEGYGVVVEVGDGVTKCAPSDRVVLSWIKGKGIAGENPKYFTKEGFTVNSGSVTTFSTYSVISENCIFQAPQGINDRLLSLFGCSLLTGGGMAIRYGSEISDGNIGVIGFGGVGAATALTLQGMSKLDLSIIERSALKRQQAVELGFNNVYESIEHSDTRYDLVFEAAGTVESIEKGFDCLKTKGTLVFASHPQNGKKISIDPHELIKGKKIFGTWGGGVDPDIDMQEIANYLQSSGANLELLLGKEFSIDEINEGLAYLDSGKPGRPLLKMNED